MWYIYDRGLYRKSPMVVVVQKVSIKITGHMSPMMSITIIIAQMTS